MKQFTVIIIFLLISSCLSAQYQFTSSKANLGKADSHELRFTTSSSSKYIKNELRVKFNERADDLTNQSDTESIGFNSIEDKIIIAMVNSWVNLTSVVQLVYDEFYQSIPDTPNMSFEAYFIPGEIIEETPPKIVVMK